jgi:hypothetical protein
VYILYYTLLIVKVPFTFLFLRVHECQQNGFNNYNHTIAFLESPPTPPPPPSTIGSFYKTPGHPFYTLEVPPFSCEGTVLTVACAFTAGGIG